MYVFDADTLLILEVNTSALLQYGYFRKEFIGLSVLKIRPEEDVEQFLEASRLLPNGYHDNGRWRHKTKSGKIFHAHIYSHKTDFEGKQAVLALAINNEAQVENEKRLHETVAQLEKQNEKLQYFSWLNSHQIRNHVANIIGLAELYNSDLTDGSLNEVLIQNIQTCARKLDGVLREIALEIKS
jgi:PAS domain S-box-containing protein